MQLTKLTADSESRAMRLWLLWVTRQSTKINDQSLCSLDSVASRRTSGMPQTWSQSSLAISNSEVTPYPLCRWCPHHSSCVWLAVNVTYLCSCILAIVSCLMLAHILDSSMMSSSFELCLIWFAVSVMYLDSCILAIEPQTLPGRGQWPDFLLLGQTLPALFGNIFWILRQRYLRYFNL